MTSSTAQPRPHSPSEDRQSNEPSMEEILASIRRLIAEDEAELGAASAVSDGRRPLPDRVAKAWAAAPAAPAAKEPEPTRESQAREAEPRSPAAANKEAQTELLVSSLARTQVEERLAGQAQRDDAAGPE